MDCEYMRHSRLDEGTLGARPTPRAGTGGSAKLPVRTKSGGRGGGQRPRFSIIIAVHNTAEFLPDCLDSLLDQGFEDFEVIAVDDASTDGSMFCLSRYAASDPRITVVELDCNSGAGAARNAGIAHARGDYVWFIDSDDWVDRDSLAKIAERLDADDPDVLLFGWSRRYPDGQASDCPASEHLRSAPTRFVLHEWPQAIRILHTPWNKVVRRELIERTGFAFATGWYQDLSFTYSMLAAANRISALAENLVNYRQRPSGAMSTRGKGHLAVLRQWSSVFSLVSAHSPRADILQPYLFDRMSWHLLEVIRKPERVPPEHWAEYLRGAKRLWTEHQPTGYRFPPGAIGIRYRMMAGRLPLPRLIPLSARAASRARRMFGLPPAGRVPGQHATPAREAPKPAAFAAAS
jgi:CDP-glycerol glycerophosphotransferase